MITTIYESCCAGTINAVSPSKSQKLHLELFSISWRMLLRKVSHLESIADRRANILANEEESAHHSTQEDTYVQVK